MSKRLFTHEEIKHISKNKNVFRCSERSITYHKDFKIRAVKLYHEGLSSTEIFRQAGFNPNIIGKDQPKSCLKRWNKSFRMKGLLGFEETRGGAGRRHKKPKDLSDVDKIKRLEIENAYLKAENDFLARLRAAKRTE